MLLSALECEPSGERKTLCLALESRGEALYRQNEVKPIQPSRFGNI